MGRKKFKLVPEMEGRIARWYARQRATEPQMEVVRKDAARLTQGLRSGARVLEIAPGPGYLAIEIARLGRFHVSGLDISQTFVAIAHENARQAGVDVEFQHGDAACVPFEAGSFDLIICQAAFKNFAEPLRALDEMHRVLRVGGSAIIQDLSKEASNADITETVRGMKLSRFNALTTQFVLGTMLRRRAYTARQFAQLVAESAFRTCDIRKDGIGLEVRLEKSALQKAA
jgi:ubiquinone/menaquinone biosynthesis C-methylase UbiE